MSVFELLNLVITCHLSAEWNVTLQWTAPLTLDRAVAVVHALLSRWLDYCNSLLTGVTAGLFCRLQSIQNVAARLVTGTRWGQHISMILRRRHWLPVHQSSQALQAGHTYF